MIAPDGSDAGSMKYAILGGEGISDQQKLEQFTGEVVWSYLKPHCDNGVLYFVDSSLKLDQVGAAFSGNCREQVEGWLKAGDLVKLGALHAAQWDGTDTLFEALVVSPFVLCRLA